MGGLGRDGRRASTALGTGCPANVSQCPLLSPLSHVAWEYRSGKLLEMLPGHLSHWAKGQRRLILHKASSNSSILTQESTPSGHLPGRYSFDVQDKWLAPSLSISAALMSNADQHTPDLLVRLCPCYSGPEWIHRLGHMLAEPPWRCKFIYFVFLNEKPLSWWDITLFPILVRA